MTTGPIRSDWVGRVIDGRFALLQWIGGSASSGVFLTELEGPPSQKAALKITAAGAADSKAWLAGSSLSHPHLMHLFHSGSCEIDAIALLYQVTDYAEENLAEILPERPLTPTETREMLDPVLDALAYLHGKSFVHGHLKPSNIMVVKDQVKLSWDRLYVAGEAGKHLPLADVYDAPDSVGEAISPAADVWSLGVTIVEALTQHPPAWDRSTQHEPVLPQSIPQPFFDIAQGCLRRDPKRRYTLSDIKTRLDPSRSLPVKAEKATGTRRSKSLVVAIVVAAFVLVAAVATLLLRSHQPSTPIASESQQPAPAIAKPSPKSPATKTKSAKGLVVSTGDEVVDGTVAERVLPDILPAAIESIHGGFSLSIRVSVDATGNVSTAEFDSPGPSRYFSRVAMEAAQRWKFKPARVGSQPVPSLWLLQFKFTQEGTEITPTEVSP